MSSWKDYTPDEIAAQPVTNIVDGWRLENGDFYLFVKCPDGVTCTVILDMSHGERVRRDPYVPVEVKW